MLCEPTQKSGNEIVIRLLDIIISVLALLVIWPLLVIILIGAWFDLGSPIFRQQRVGFNGAVFTLFKFRSMKRDTANLPTHLIPPGQQTRFGSILRTLKLDELLQLVNVLKGDMGIVGPRPGLPDDQQLYVERSKLGVFGVRPGITGLSQVRGLDMSDPKKLALSDSEWVTEASVGLYVKIIACTLLPLHCIKSSLRVLL